MVHTLPIFIHKEYFAREKIVQGKLN